MPHVVVIGAGVFGTWTAFHLHESGAAVTLVDAYGPGNSRSSSGDESRVIRCGYGRDAIYSSMARESLAQWRALEQFALDRGPRVPGSPHPVFHPCGVLWLAPEDDEYLADTRRTLQSGGYDVEVVDRAAVRARYPQLTADDSLALLEPAAGVLMARRSVRGLAARLQADGVELHCARIVRPQDVAALRPRAGPADAYVFACGPWLPKVFPALLAGRIRSTRQAVLYFGVPAGDRRFGSDRMPVCVEFRSEIYSLPDIDGRGFKIGIDRHGPPFDPDADDRTIDEESMAMARAWLQRRFPALADAPLIESRVCQYENTSNGDFLIDRHPDFRNVWLVGGGSGHGFKHGPAVGALVAQMVLKDTAADPRFSLETKRTEAARSVY